MNKDFYLFNKEREDWSKSPNSIINKGIKEQLFKKLKSLNIELSGKRIVQLGCLNGELIQSFINKGAFVHAVDFSETLLHKTQIALLSSENFHKYQLSKIIRDFSILSDFTFDIVIAVTMLEHLPEDMTERIIEDAKRLLKEKVGIFIFRLPLGKKHETIKSSVNPHLDYNIWTHEELTKLALKYRYQSFNIDDISIFYKGGNQ